MNDELPPASTADSCETGLALHRLATHPGARRRSRRVGRGRGSGFGKTAGRGHKGQKSRSGGLPKAGFEGGQMPLQRRLPKVGFRSRTNRDHATLRLHEIEAMTSDQIDLAALKAAGLVKKQVRRAAIILRGTITRPVVVCGIRVSRGARAAIEAVGGRIEES